MTTYHPDERWPCGPFPNQSTADEGLPAWTAADRPIEDTDVVLWYVFGIHHITRMEDWPIMPVDTVSFWLKPFGFFDRNPALRRLGAGIGARSFTNPGVASTRAIHAAITGSSSSARLDRAVHVRVAARCRRPCSRRWRRTGARRRGRAAERLQ